MMLEIHYMVQLALLFVVIATGAWRKSISTTLFVAVLVIVFYSIKPCYPQWEYVLANIVSVFAVFRAILQKKNDTLIRG